MQRSRRSATFDRRAALRMGAGASAALLAGTAIKRGRAAASSDQVEPSAGAWKPWVLVAGNQFRPSPPPDKAVTTVELADLKTLAANRTPDQLDQISYWNAGDPGYRWIEIATSQSLRAFPTAPQINRAMALVSVAIADTLIAVWDAKYAYNRPRPGVADPSLMTALPTPASPSFPAEYAAVAAAASSVLAFLMPDAAGQFQDQAQQAAQAHRIAGVQYASDVDAGVSLGQAVAAQVISWAKADGSDAPFTGSYPTGYGAWRPNPGTTGVAPLMGNWKTWILDAGAQYRPAPPAAPDSDDRAAEIAEVRDFPRSIPVQPAVAFWGDDPLGRPVPGTPQVGTDFAIFHWGVGSNITWWAEISQKLLEYGLAANPPRAARVVALVAAAAYDAAVACWDAKYAYLVGRPVQFDPAITTTLPTYNHPSFPSAHSSIAGATSTVLGYLFPREADFFRSRAEELAASRLWAGIHFRSDCEVGLDLGRMVGKAAVQRALNDGAA